MKRILPIALVALLAAGAGAWFLLDSDDDDSSKPSGIIPSEVAREVDLDITRPEFDAEVKVEPVKTQTQRVERRTTDLAKADPDLRAALRKRYEVKNGKAIIPAQTYECLLYRGERPKAYVWQFCFGEAGRLEFVSTTPPV